MTRVQPLSQGWYRDSLRSSIRIACVGSPRRIQRAHREGKMLWEDMVAALNVLPEPYPVRYLVMPVAG